MFKNSFRVLILSILILSITFLGIGCNKDQKSEHIQSNFDSFINEMFVEQVQTDTLSLNYSLSDPEKYGIENINVTLGEYSIDRMNEGLRLSENYLKKLNKFNYEELKPDQQLTYDILTNYLETDLSFEDYLYYSECLGPTTGVQSQLPILLAEYNFYSKEDIDRYIKLLPCVYDYFKDITEFEKEKSSRGLFMNDEVADKIIEQCNAFINDPENNFLIDYFNEKISNYKGLTKKEISNYRKANREGVLKYVVPSYELLIKTLKELKGTGVNEAGLYYYPEGQSYYELLAAYKTGSSRDMDEISKMLDQAIGDGILKVSQISFVDPNILDKYADFASFPITNPDDILVDLKKDISAEFPDPVPVNCEIKYVDESLADYLSPAMYLVPAMDNYKDNNIYINGKDKETLSKIYTTVAHEGYPGHLYQCVYFRNQDPAPIRNVMDFLGYDEGWATYVEFYSYHLAGIDENLADFLEVNNAVILLMYARADIGIHYEGWTEKKAVAYINNFIGDDITSKSIFHTLLEEPAVYLPYAVGYLEISELREKAEDALDDAFVAKDFHQFLLDIGPAQFSVIDNYMDEWLESKRN